MKEETMTTATRLLFWIAVTVQLVFSLSDGIGVDGSSSRSSSTSSSSSTRRNIILFMTDDQDVTANSTHPAYMPGLHRLFREAGIEFPNYYVSTGLCCPSRATILRGQYCHNTKIFDNGDLNIIHKNSSSEQSGGWSKFLDTGLEDETIATLLQSAGYKTAMIGKYMNGYDLGKAGLHKPPGWDHWMGLLTCFKFYGPVFSNNGTAILKTNKTVYQTDFIRDWVLEFLEQRDPSRPFFLVVTPFAPHAPATPAKRHEHLFPNHQFPRQESFNPPSTLQEKYPAWIARMPELTKKQIDDMDNFYRNRLRSLQAVDEALVSISKKLDVLNLTDNTYFIYTADNGQHFGDHRIPAGKRQAYETDVLVPFFVRGPGIRKGSHSSEVVQSVDLGPTFLEIASSSSRKQHRLYEIELGVDSRSRSKKITSTYPMDGKSMLPLLTSSSSSSSITAASDLNSFRWAALIEMYSGSSNIGLRYKHMKGYYHNHMYPNTYQAVRVIDGPSERASTANLLYVEWCTGEQELYNMTVDPHQVHNLIVAPPVMVATSPPATTTTTQPPERNESPTPFVFEKLLPLVERLSKLLAKLGNCIGSECYDFNRDQLFGSDMAVTGHSNLSDDGVDVRVARSLRSMQSSIRNRIPCHDPPPKVAAKDTHKNIGRKLFAYDRYVPEPFQYGFPFSDGEMIGEDLLRTWEAYKGYFY